MSDKKQLFIWESTYDDPSAQKEVTFNSGGDSPVSCHSYETLCRAFSKGDSWHELFLSIYKSSTLSML
jgi:hypothetical protein